MKRPPNAEAVMRALARAIDRLESPEQIAIGDAVVAGFDRLDDETTLPTWEVVR